MSSKIQNPKSKIQNPLISLGLFLLALLPRAYDLQRFVTADEAKWVYRSAQFLAAFLRGDFPATSVNLTPAVTTTWLGSLGLTLYYRFNQSAINLPFADWLVSLPEFRADMPLLVATRWPMVIFTSLGVVVIYLLARRLFNPTLAFIAAAFIALDPHTVALSRILGHDAPAAVFMSISLLLLLLTVNCASRQGGSFSPALVSVGASTSPEATLPRSLTQFLSPYLFLILSAITAGLSFLSKAPALFLIPFAGLVFLGKVWGDSATFAFWAKRFLLWLVVAYLTFTIIWPAAWVNPVGQPWAVVENAFLSATDQQEADSENYWRVPNLGPLYYVVNGAFKLSPLVLMGLGLSVIPLFKRRVNQSVKNDNPPHSPAPILWLLTFALLFTIFMTFGDKRSPRYILPIFPPLTLIAAFGWLRLYQVAGGRIASGDSSCITPSNLWLPASRIIFPFILTLSALAILLPYAPYYFSYFNPLLGGPYTAPHLVKIGWGEGLDQVGRFLQREVGDSRIGTAYASTVSPFFKGEVSNVTGDSLDYIVLYSKQIQSGEPSPAFIRYFEQVGSIFSVELNGIHYADVYPGPAVQPALISDSEADTLPQPIGFRPLTPYGHIGRPLEVDVLWPADDAPSSSSVTVALAPISIFDFSNEDASDTIVEDDLMLAEGQGHPAHLADDLIVSRHRLLLPEELVRGKYALLVDGRLLGEIELRHFQPPAKMGAVDDVVFADQIALIGYQFEPTEDYIAVNIAWKAKKSRLPNYTVFVQLLNAETNERVAGIDTQPLKGEWPTGRWVKGEVVADEYLVAVPYGLPPDFYRVIVGLYQSETGQRLILNTGQDHWLLPWDFIRKE